jgi:hypothetical protein
MPTKRTPEQKFIDQISEEMFGTWKRTRHEDGQVTPGVPDLSYVMVGGPFETGWMECKYGEKAALEPSQHNWIEFHHTRIPVHILWGIGNTLYLFEGHDHGIIRPNVHFDKIAILICPINEARQKLTTALKQLTHRGRNGI